MTQYLYNSEGLWIASRKDKVVYDRDGRWIGWLPWGDGQVVNTDGEYLATIVEGDRLYRELEWKPRDFPGYPGYQENLNETVYPGFAGQAPKPSNMADVNV